VDEFSLIAICLLTAGVGAGSGLVSGLYGGAVGVVATALAIGGLTSVAVGAAIGIGGALLNWFFSQNGKHYIYY
jgi:hypothetical protein